MEFQTCAVATDDDGGTFYLRELSAGAVEVIEEMDSEFTRAIALLGLSLCTDRGDPVYDPKSEIEKAMDFVRELPASLVREKLIPAATELNGLGRDSGN